MLYITFFNKKIFVLIFNVFQFFLKIFFVRNFREKSRKLEENYRKIKKSQIYEPIEFFSFYQFHFIFERKNA